MKIKSILTCALGVLALSSCSKDEVSLTTPPTGTTSVRLTLLQDDGTRAEGSTITNSDADKVVFGGGVICFADATTITRIMTISSNPTNDSNLNLGEITTSGATGGALAENVPNSSTQIFIVGNLASGYASLMEGQSINEINNLVARLSELDDVTALPLLGSDVITPPANEGDEATASVSLRTVASRIEIGQLKAESSSGIDSYELVGIFINNYYDSQKIGGVVIENTLKNNGNVQANYVLNGSGSYNDQNKYIIFDWYEGQSVGSVGGIIKPSVSVANPVWGYNVFPAKNVTSEDDNLPHIVIVLDNIVVGGQNVNGKRYLTLNSFKSGGVVLEEFKNGVSYKIGTIEFDEEDLFVTPETEPITVNVQVSVLAWEIRDLEWNK